MFYQISDSLVNSWCCFIFLIVFCYHFKQNLLASGVQSDSDMEELDDEVKACFFYFWFCL